MKPEKTFHHEAHEDHEDFLWGSMTLGGDSQGESCLANNRLLFFVSFVCFVVKKKGFA
jgi:hypothetical protein